MTAVHPANRNGQNKQNASPDVANFAVLVEDVPGRVNLVRPATAQAT